MMEKDEELVKRFMLRHKQEVADNGFSERVIRRLPRRAERLSKLLTGICIVLCCFLYFACNGIGIVMDFVSKIVAACADGLAMGDFNYRTLVVVAIVVAIVGAQWAYNSAE